MSARRRRIAVVVAALGLLVAPARDRARGASPESVPIETVAGEAYVGVNDFARLLGATKFWRPDLRQLVLRARAHSVVLTVDNPFAVVNATTVWLPAPVRTRGGEIQVPVAIIPHLPVDSTIARLLHDPRRDRVVVLPPGGVVASPRVVVTEAATQVVFPVERPEDALVVSRARTHFRVRMSGFFSGTLPDTLPAGSLVRSIEERESVVGSAFEIGLAAGAAGYRMIRDDRGRRIVLEFPREGEAALERFAPEGPPGPRPIRVIVLDPGHGGDDAGVAAGSAVEKDLALALALRLKAELERRLAARVVLTREDDRALTVDQRAEAANRARADLVVSLHFDGFAGPSARGATAFVPRATFAGAPEGGLAGAGPILVLPWRDVATRHAVQSRALAEAVLGALELHDRGPTRLREILPYNLLGVNAPGMLLECATLTSRADRERLASDVGVAALAVAVAEGIVAYQRNE